MGFALLFQDLSCLYTEKNPQKVLKHCPEAAGIHGQPQSQLPHAGVKPSVALATPCAECDHFLVINIHLEQDWQLQSGPGFASCLGCLTWVLKHYFCLSSATNPQLSWSVFGFQQNKFLLVSESAKSLWCHWVRKFVLNENQILTPEQNKMQLITRDWVCFPHLWICLVSSMCWVQQLQQGFLMLC